MSPTVTESLFATLKRTIQEVLDSKKALSLLFGIVTALLTALGGVLFAHLGVKLGLDPALAADIPKGAAWLAGGILALAGGYFHTQGRVDVATASAPPPVMGTPEFKTQLTDLAGEVVKAAVDAHLPTAIATALSKPATTSASTTAADYIPTASVAPPAATT